MRELAKMIALAVLVSRGPFCPSRTLHAATVEAKSVGTYGMYHYFMANVFYSIFCTTNIPSH